MDVSVTELRSQLSDWLARVRVGEEVVITERGIPVARLIGMDESTTALERLSEQGVIGRPSQPARPAAAARLRPRSGGSLVAHVSDQRQ